MEARPRTTSRGRTALLLATLTALLLANGCGGPIVETEPLAASDLERIAASLDIAAPIERAFRWTGTGLISTQVHRSPFAFAAVYDHPAWLRADIRPSSPAAPSGFAAQLLVERGCARLLFPSSLVMVSDCLDELPLVDPALLLFGLVSGDDLRELESTASGEHDDLLVVTGRRGASQMEFVFDPGSFVLTMLSVRGEDDTWVTIDYEGHGWKEPLPFPRTAILKFGRGGRTQARVRLEFDRMRAIDAVDRTALDVIAPPGTTVSSWGDLALWR